MRISNQTNHYVCLSCRFGYHQARNITSKVASEPSKSSERSRSVQTLSDAQAFPAQTPRASSSTSTAPHLRWVRPSTSRAWRKSAVQVRQYATHASVEPSASFEPDMISPKQMKMIRGLSGWQKKLRNGLANVPNAAQETDGLSIEQVIHNLPDSDQEKSLASLLLGVYAGKTFGEVESDLSKLASLSDGKKLVDVEGVTDVLTKLGIVDHRNHTATQRGVPSKSLQKAKLDSAKVRRTGSAKVRSIDSAKVRRTGSAKVRGISSKGVIRVRSVPAALMKKEDITVAKSSEVTREGRRQSRIGKTVLPPAQKLEAHDHIDYAIHGKSERDISSMNVLDASAITMQPLRSDSALKVPKLGFDLSRVLFNPGVYQLKDPRSKVYNFDPYLEKLMPIGHFNHEALNKYVTASEDETLTQLAREHNKKYTGSTSSLSTVLSQFHFLLSAWRPLNLRNLSANFEGVLSRFTVITRAPSSVFLRCKKGAYAVDADKQFDNPNVLMLLGHAIEKLLTLDKADYERYRLKTDGSENDDPGAPPEAYHYSGLGDFLFRSQLDAQDKRLPGAGMFDLKSRAVAGIRMNMDEYEIGQGYEIRHSLGLWESYEREFFDMVRSAFLKYSMQVRMGRMDGIFVAYHNISRIFGFQYLPLPQLDFTLHGQSDRCLGDQEFNVSVSMLSEVFNMATQRFPNQSLRFHFETREISKTEPLGYMQIFAEVVDDDQIQNVQDQSKEKVELKQKEILKADPTIFRKVRSAESHAPLPAAREQSSNDQVSQGFVSPKQTPSTQESTAADVDFLDEISGSASNQSASKSPSTNPNLIGWKLRIYNFVNDKRAMRPTNLKPEDRWSIRYEFERIPDSKVTLRYQQCTTRRRAALSQDRSVDTPFRRDLRELSLKGAAWRAQQDALEAEEGAGVWYEPEHMPQQ